MYNKCVCIKNVRIHNTNCLIGDEYYYINYTHVETKMEIFEILDINSKGIKCIYTYKKFNEHFSDIQLRRNSNLILILDDEF